MRRMHTVLREICSRSSAQIVHLQATDTGGPFGDYRATDGMLEVPGPGGLRECPVSTAVGR